MTPSENRAKHILIPRMIAYFVDTNFFLHFKDPLELPWLDLPSSADDIDLLVPTAVVTELDNHKGRGTGRKSRRARQVSSDLGKADDAQDGKLVLSERDPRLTLGCPPFMKIDFNDWPDLDRFRPDHQIAAQAATYNRDVGPAPILTNDLNLIRVARAIGVPVQRLPASWELPPTPDERDQEIAKLTSENRQLKAGRPDIKLAVLDAATQGPTTELHVRCKRYGDTSRVVDDVMAKLNALYPMAETFEASDQAKVTLGFANFGMSLIEPSPEEIARYQQATYPGWEKRIRQHIEQLVRSLGEKARMAPLIVSIENVGHANAVSTRLSITAHDGILVHRSWKPDGPDTPAPKPPDPPKARYGWAAAASLSQLMRGLDDYGLVSQMIVPSLASINQRRDPNAFYYLSGGDRTDRDELVLTCEALPHQVDPYISAFGIYVLDFLEARQARINIQVHASNVLKPIDRHVVLNIVEEDADLVTDIMTQVGKDWST